MKKSLVLEYRIRKLERLFLEDIDDDFEIDADAILQKKPYVDLDKELDNSANRIIGKQNKVEFDTVNDWIDVNQWEYLPVILHFSTNSSHYQKYLFFYIFHRHMSRQFPRTLVRGFYRL